jgi:hypothetical protein
MKRSRFTEEQIIAVLQEQEAGVPRRLKSIPDSPYRWVKNGGHVIGAISISVPDRPSSCRSHCAGEPRCRVNSMLRIFVLTFEEPVDVQGLSSELRAGVKERNAISGCYKA